MRKAEGKDLGYIILPITVPPGVPPEISLNNNENYQVVWQLLNALRAHDERIDSDINRLSLGENISDLERINLVGIGGLDELDATTAVIEDINTNEKKLVTDDEDDEETLIGADVEDFNEESSINPEQLSFIMSDLSNAIKAKIVDKCGTRDYWEKWAGDIAKIAEQHIKRIKAIVNDKKAPERKIFLNFLEEIRDDLNPEITEDEAVEMLAQHIITKPVFDSLFQESKFSEKNAVSRAIEKIIDNIYERNIESEQTESLKRFYKSVKRRIADVTKAETKQALILQLYDRFFKYAFPKMTQRLGIVYTPTEVVDFIIQSVENVMQTEFNSSLGNKGVHILDPFTGTGTFISRLLQSGILSKEQIRRKFNSEIHANEIVLLAYYIACINIEAVYEEQVKENQYQSFDGMVLTDTFQLYEQEMDMIDNLLPDNSERRTKQKKLKINVIIGNPPYSAGQSSVNDNAANIPYKNLDDRIRQTYAADTKHTNKKFLYDSYIRSIRWASDRIGDVGMVAFISGSSWVERNSADGIRKHLRDEFDQIYVVNLRGDIRKNMLTKNQAGEGENIFGSGSMTGIAIGIFVKSNNSDRKKIHYFDIGDNKSRIEKLETLKSFASIKGISKENKFQLIEPNEKNDWINKGNREFEKFIEIGNKKSKEIQYFPVYSAGVQTQRDVWCVNFSKNKLLRNLETSSNFYNDQVSRFVNDKSGTPASKFIDRNISKFKWCQRTISNLEQGKKIEIQDHKLNQYYYRPFTKTFLYRDKILNWSNYLQSKLFPDASAKNRIILVSGVGARSGASALITDTLPDLQCIDNGQGFPISIYLNEEKSPLFSTSNGVSLHSGISNEILQHFINSYPKKTIKYEDIFYYVYGILHSEQYKTKFANNLSKELPRIPVPKDYEKFTEFSKLGKKLGDLHLNFEHIEKYPVTFREGDLNLSVIQNHKDFFRVEKMKFPKTTDKTVLKYNQNITLENIPLEAYEYKVSGKSALEWVIERQCIKTDKATGIVNDANDYANETMNNPAYPLELFQRVITVSLETMKIVKSLPKLDID